MLAHKYAVAVLFLFWLLQTSFSQSDKKANPNSPVFKNYRPPTTAPLLEQSDATYQMWQGFKVLQQANAGDAMSQFELSIRYLTGRGFKTDTVKSAYWTAKAAAQNHLLARYNLAIFQFNGWGTEWNPFEGFRHFRFAAERNIPEAQYVLAQLFTENLVVPRNLDSAYAWLKVAADSGYAPATVGLKELDKRGYRPPDSSSTKSTVPTTAQQANTSSGAIQLLFLNFSSDSTKTPADSVLLDDALKAAVLARNPEAERMAGAMKINAERLQIDSEAVGMIRQSAEYGSPEALTLLGRSYELGVKVPKDPVLAAKQYIRAVRFDSPRAGRLLVALLQEKEFFAQLRARVTRNDPDALYVWPTLVALGFDRQLTDAQALQMLERAAAQQHFQAMIELGLCYYAGRWTNKNDRRAEEYWRQASRLGSHEAEIRLAMTALRRESNPSAIAGILHDAAQQGSVLAEFGLGYCYETGKGVAQNKPEAIRLYRNSAQRGSQDAMRALQRIHDEIRPKAKEFKIINSWGR